MLEIKFQIPPSEVTCLTTPPPLKLLASSTSMVGGVLRELDAGLCLIFSQRGEVCLTRGVL